MTCGIAGSLWRVVAGGACGGLRGVAGGARCLRRLCGFGGGARSAVCPVGGSGSRRGVSVLGTARNRLATGVRGVDAPTAAGGHPPTRPLLAVRGSPRPRSGYPSSPYAALPAIAPGTPPRRTRLSPPSLRVPLLAVRGSPRQRPASPAPPYAAPPPSLRAAAAPRPCGPPPAPPPRLRIAAMPPPLRAVVPLGRHGWAQRHPATPGRAPPCARTHPGHRVRRRARDPHRPRVPANLGSPHPLPSPKPPPGDRVNRSGGLVR